MQVKAALIAPIFQGEQCWGVLVVHHCSGTHAWRSIEVDLVQRLSTKMGIAIQQTELFRQVQHLNETLETQVEERTQQLQELLTFESLLKRITDKVRSSLDKHQILQTAVQELAIHLHLDACDCALYDLEKQISTITYEYVCRGNSALGTTWCMSKFPEFYEQLLTTDTCFQFCDRHQTRGWVAIMACPLWDDRGVLGDLWLVRPKHEWFSESEIRLIQQVVNQCAIAIRQARLYQAVQRQVDELERLNQLKDDFLSTVSHELRTPIASIKMASQMLEVTLTQRNLLTPDNAPLSRYLHVLQEECDREIQLVNDLLDLSRLEAESVPLFLSVVPLRVWLPHLTESFLPRIHQHQCQLSISIPDGLPDIVSDTALLERILVELFNNACKYTPPGEQITLSARYDDKGVCIEICNSGVEIPLEARSHLFDKFYRVPNADPWKQGGTGLGLALVKRIVEELQGTIELQYRPGCTAFTVQLPLSLPG
jgi:signal transduction histidine kinase/histone H3/H4